MADVAGLDGLRDSPETERRNRVDGYQVVGKGGPASTESSATPELVGIIREGVSWLTLSSPLYLCGSENGF
jgi:hypothetical protein